MVVNGENKQFNLAWDDFTSADYCTSKCMMYEKCSGNRECCFKKILEDVLHTLTESEEVIMRLRMGFCGGKPFTLAQVEEQLGLTRERIRQIESKAWRKLRHPSRIKQLFDTGANSCNITSVEELIAAVSMDSEQGDKSI